MSELQKHIALVKTSIQEAQALNGVERLSAEMLERFFAVFPEAEEIFEPFDRKQVNMTKFYRVGEALIDVLEHPHYSETAVYEEVYRHRTYSIKDKEYYFVMADSFVATLKNTLRDSWTDDHEEVWNDALAALKHNVSLAAKKLL
ncbi:MAG TPA: globin [Pseudomonadales bacterium]|jgi:hemoglobin-like flavoprotein